MERVGTAVGGRHNTAANQDGYFRMSFHPEDDKEHGAEAHRRSRAVADHILADYPRMGINHYRDDDGSHHLEMPHHDIPSAIKHLKDWREYPASVI